MNAVARVVGDSVSAWPSSLPWPQIPSVQINWDKPTDDIGTLAGPTRFRLANPNVSPSYEFEITFTADECERFEAWYDTVVARGGEVYLPWIGEGRILYLNEYELAPLGTAWKLHALAVQLYIDKDYIERHVCDGACAWRVPVIVDADATYPIITCDLPGLYRRKRVVDEFFGTARNARLTDEYDAADRFITDLGSDNWWNGNTWGHDGNPGELAAGTDTVTANLQATNIFIDIPTNWMWDDHLEEWYASVRMTYIDSWKTLWIEDAVNACRLIKDTLPPPWPILNGNDALNFAWKDRIVADMFPLECYFPVRVDFALPTLEFAVAPTTVDAGGSAMLTWSSANAHRLIASGGWSGNQQRSGTANTGPLWQPTSFTLSARGCGGEVTQTVTVATSLPLPTATITANPQSVVTGGSSVLTWSTTNATTVTASGGWSGSLAPSGSVGKAVPGTTTFTITARNVTGSASASVTVTVTEPPPPPPPLFSSQLRVVAQFGGAQNQYGFFITPGPIGSVSPGNLPAGGSALGRRIRAIASQTDYDLYIMCDGATGLTQTNQFDSVSVVDDAGATRVFTTATQAGLTFGNDPLGYAVWWWAGSNRVMRTAGKTYTFTFTKAT